MFRKAGESNTGPYSILSQARAKCLTLMSSDIPGCFAIYKKIFIWCENDGLKELVSKAMKWGKGALTLVKVCLLAKSQINISCSSGLKT